MYIKQVYRERGMRSYDDYTVHNFLLEKILRLPFKTQHWKLKMVWKRIQVIHCSTLLIYLSLGRSIFQEFHRWQILLAIYLPKLSAQSITSWAVTKPCCLTCIAWVRPIPSNSHHQDWFCYIFSKGFVHTFTAKFHDVLLPRPVGTPPRYP